MLNRRATNNECYYSKPIAVYASFIHSFIQFISIAPLQGYYSEALPTLARLKGTVLRIIN